MRSAHQFEQKDKTTDTMKLTATSKIEDELLHKLVDPEAGILKPGAMPKMQTATSAGCSKLLGAMSTNSKAPECMRARLHTHTDTRLCHAIFQNFLETLERATCM